jgi:maleylacetate reductase
MWDEFVYQSLPMRVVFGAGTSTRLDEEVDRLGLTRVLVLCTPEQEPLARRIADGLGPRAAGVYPHARMHVPIEVAAQARAAAAELGADGCGAAGGGSTIGLGKAIALEHGLPVIAVPTTYAGSEMTPIWSLTEQGRKRTGARPCRAPLQRRLRPGTHAHPARLPLGDQRLQRGGARGRRPLRPGRLADHLAHGARGGAGRARGAAARGRPADGPGGAIARSVRRLAVRRDARRDHDVAAPQALPRPGRHLRPAARRGPHRRAPARRGVQRAGLSRPDPVLGADPGGALWDLATKLGAPRSLAELGMPASGVSEVVRQAVAAPYANPRPLTEDDLTRLVESAHRGERPTSS